MQEAEAKEARAILGLKEGAGEAEIESVRHQLLAFLNASAGDSEALKALSEKAATRVSSSAATLLQKKSESATTFDTNKTAKETAVVAVAGKTDKKNGLFWFLGIAACLGILVVFLNKPEPARNRNSEPYRPRSIELPQGSTGQQTLDTPPPSQIPEYAKPFLHADVADRINNWSSGREYFGGTKYVVLKGFDGGGKLVNEIVLYDDNGGPGLVKQFVVRRDDSANVVSVQRFMPSTSSAGVFKDRRNVAENGDVHSQTTFYTFNSSGQLTRAQVDTQFVEGFDGLTFDRSSGSLYVTRDKSPGQLNISGNPSWLNNTFDLWSEFGQTN